MKRRLVWELVSSIAASAFRMNEQTKWTYYCKKYFLFFFFRLFFASTLFTSFCLHFPRFAHATFLREHKNAFLYLTKLYKRGCHRVASTIQGRHRGSPSELCIIFRISKMLFIGDASLRKNCLCFIRRWLKVMKGGRLERMEWERGGWVREREFKIIITLKISTQNVDFVHVFWSVSTLHHVWLAFNFNGKVRFTFWGGARASFLAFSSCLLLLYFFSCFSTRVTTRS